MSVRQLGEAWTSGKLLEQHGAVNRLRKKAGAYIDSVTLAAYGAKTRGPNAPAFGDMSVTAVTAEDLQAVMASQPKEQRAETRNKQYNRLHRLFELAEFPCRLRPEGTNPVKKYLRPAGDADKLFCFLYPAEIVALLGAKHIPLARRVL